MIISIIIPMYNEEKSILGLLKELVGILEPEKFEYEVIIVNDGSIDNSWGAVKGMSRDNKKIKSINLRHNYGQTIAMRTGINNSSGDIIVAMDADGQNDPKDILKLLKKFSEGYDVVSGWRKDRMDEYFSRIIPSRTANWLISKVTGVKLNDFGCTLKAYKSRFIKDINLYGEMHRFIPVYAAWRGAKITEVIVNHRPRVHGRTKYGIIRTYKVILDLLMVKFLFKYMNRPIHFFGGIGFISLFLGMVSGITALALKLGEVKDMVETPLPVFSALLIIVGVVLIAMGVLAEMVMRLYYESQGKEPYFIKEKINF